MGEINSLRTLPAKTIRDGLIFGCLVVKKNSHTCKFAGRPFVREESRDVFCGNLTHVVSSDIRSFESCRYSQSETTVPVDRSFPVFRKFSYTDIDVGDLNG